jgi:GT2 family glycosyltransferase
VTAAARVSAVVVSFNTRDELLRCLAALRGGASRLGEIVVVDNASQDGSPDAVRAAFPDVRVIANADNRGFSAANNQGFRAATGEYLLVVNSDAEVRPGAVDAMAALLDEQPDVGIVGPRTVGSDGQPQVSFGPELTLRSEWAQRRLVRGVREGRPDALRAVRERSARAQEPDWVSGSCLLGRRAALDAVGFFDEAFFLYEEDVDLCVRVRRAGWRVLYTPDAEVVHHLGRSMAQAPERAGLEYQRSHLLYYRKHNGPLATSALRAGLAARGAARWLGGVAAGTRGAADRRQGRALLTLALFG